MTTPNTEATIRLAENLTHAASFPDILTCACGVLFGIVGFFIRRKARPGRDHHFRGFITDMLQGVAFFPFLLIAASLVSGQILQALLATSRGLLSLAGFIGAFYVLGEFVRMAEREAKDAQGS
jgi:hypothetical protein